MTSLRSTNVFIGSAAHSGVPVCVQSSPDLLDVNTFALSNIA
ncbi:hypothetical protein ACWF99_30310 [Nocardia sp. NPDC055002]